MKAGQIPAATAWHWGIRASSSSEAIGQIKSRPVAQHRRRALAIRPTRTQAASFLRMSSREGGTGTSNSWCRCAILDAACPCWECASPRASRHPAYPERRRYDCLPCARAAHLLPCLDPRFSSSPSLPGASSAARACALLFQSTDQYNYVKIGCQPSLGFLPYEIYFIKQYIMGFRQIYAQNLNFRLSFLQRHYPTSLRLRIRDPKTARGRNHRDRVGGAGSRANQYASSDEG